MACWFFLLLFVCFSHSYKFFFFPANMGVSHELALLRIAASITTKDSAHRHDVRILLRESTLKIAKTSFSFSRWPTVVSYNASSVTDDDVLDLGDVVAFDDPFTGLKKLLRTLTAMTVESEQRARLYLETENFVPDVVVADSLSQIALTWSTKLTATQFVLAQCVGLSAPYLEANYGVVEDLGFIPMTGAQIPHIKTFAHRLVNVLCWGLSRLLGRFAFTALTARAAADLGFSDPDYFYGMKREPMIVLSSWIVELPRLLPPNVVLTGSVLAEPGRELDSEWSAWMNTRHDNDIVLVSLGTGTRVIRDDREKFLQMFLKADEFRFVWKVQINASSLPSNVKAGTWLPQNDLLASGRLCAFVSHVGLNSMYQTFYHGVPLVSLPRFGDQFDNAATAERLGVGITLSPSSSTPDELAHAVRRVCSDANMQARAKELSRKLKLENGADRAAQQLLEWAEIGNTHHLTMIQYHTLSWYQRTAADAIAAIIFTALLIVLGLLWCCTKAARKFCATNQKKKTE